MTSITIPSDLTLVLSARNVGLLVRHFFVDHQCSHRHHPGDDGVCPLQRGRLHASAGYCLNCMTRYSYRSHCRPWLNRQQRRLTDGGVAAVVTSLLYFKQKALIYPSHIPANSRTDVPRPNQYNLKDYEELLIPTSDGEKLSAFYIRGPGSSSGGRSQRGRASDVTVIMFHGNAGNIGHRIPIARMMIGTTGCNVFMLEYRGYGLSTGEPDEAGLNVDAQTALDYLRERAETRDHKFVVYGQSLGGAVSIRLVAKNQHAGDIQGLILENTFLSMRKLIPSVIPPAKYLTLLCHQVWPSDTWIPGITEVPILFLSGLQDEIVPPTHMRQLYELSTAPTKIWRAFPGGDHNSSVLEEGYFEAVAEFIGQTTGQQVAKEKDESATSRSTAVVDRETRAARRAARH